jgi:hypothetical protein
LRNQFIDGEFFQEFLKELPIPVIGLPQSCIEEPWWLIYIGHEVGHHIQHDLLPDYRLVGRFGACLEEAAKKATQTSRRSARWKQWGQEVFADAFSVYALGVWAAWAMTELILGNDLAMLTEAANYPAPAVRLALMAELATELDLDGASSLRGFDPLTLTTGDPLKDKEDHDLRKEAEAHLALVGHVVQAIREYPFEGLGKFEPLGWQASDFEPGGSIQDWTDRLRGRKSLTDKKHLDLPRLIASAGLAAWAEIADLPDAAQRADAKAVLVPRFLDAVTKSGPMGRRAAPKPPPVMDMAGKGERFAQRFLEVGLKDLGL